MLPQVSFRGAFEADRQRFVDRGGANWLAAVSLRWNLFNGSADKARIAETGHLVKRAECRRAAHGFGHPPAGATRIRRPEGSPTAHRGGQGGRGAKRRRACASRRTATKPG